MVQLDGAGGDDGTVHHPQLTLDVPLDVGSSTFMNTHPGDPP